MKSLLWHEVEKEEGESTCRRHNSKVIPVFFLSFNKNFFSKYVVLNIVENKSKKNLEEKEKSSGKKYC